MKFNIFKRLADLENSVYELILTARVLTNCWIKDSDKIFKIIEDINSLKSCMVVQERILTELTSMLQLKCGKIDKDKLN